MALPSLNDILSQYDIAEEDLNKECSGDIRYIIDWQVTGYCLDIPKEKIAAIHVDKKTEEQRRIALLDTWHM